MRQTRKQRRNKQRAEIRQLLEIMRQQLAKHTLHYEALPDEPNLVALNPSKN